MQRLREHRVPLIVFTATAMCLFLGTRWSPGKPYWLKDSLTFIVFMPLPLLAVYLLDGYEKTWTRVLWLGGALLTLAPVLHRNLVDKELYLAQPELLVGPAVIGTALIVAACKLGGVKADDWGLGLGDWRWWGPWTALLMVLAIGLSVVCALVFPSFREAYPWYEPARTDAGELFGYQLSLGVYMVGWEFFFRGFMNFGVARTSGPVMGALVQAIPFMLVHRAKPKVEMLASFFGAVGLALFCWRGRSFWPAVILHWGLNAAMEFTCFALRNGSG
ncbi:MAG: CPBP family intramembrane metalloprotease [Proteobacteria bacterium]|nr:CPBP family intramembrane metalloprotease [Pseudomonadota bacterium]MCP4916150.1 CPBP family intramembrane metalloprotease [Pseudomonadota bacterium]